MRKQFHSPELVRGSDSVFMNLKLIIMIVTYEWLRQRTFDFHSVSRRQAEILGIPYPLEHGWIQDSIGRDLTSDDAREFSIIANVNKHKRDKKYARKNASILSEFGFERKPLFDNMPSVTFDDMRKIN